MASLRFLTDENISPQVVAALREAGYHVTDVKERRAFGWLDERLLAWARPKGLTILTHDKDFAELLKRPLGRQHAGVIFIRLHDQHPHTVVSKLLPVVAQLRARRLRNALVIIGDESVEYLRG